VRTQFVDAANGVRFAYREAGPRRAEPLVLLAHFRGNLDAWDPALVAALSITRPIIMVDNAGIGRSSGETPRTVDAMALDAAAFADALHLRQADVLGFSLGGYVAQQLAADRPDLVRRLVLAGTAPPGTGADRALSGSVHARATKPVLGPRDLLSLFFPVEHTEAGLAYLRRLGAPRSDPDLPVRETSWRAQIDAARDWGNSTFAQSPHQPTLVAHGAADVMVDVDKAELIPASTRRIYPGCGHGFLFQEPRRFAADVNDFLEA